MWIFYQVVVAVDYVDPVLSGLEFSGAAVVIVVEGEEVQIHQFCHCAASNIMEYGHKMSIKTKDRRTRAEIFI